MIPSPDENLHNLLSVMSDEDLIRMAYRLHRAGKDETASFLDDILLGREFAEKEFRELGL